MMWTITQPLLRKMLIRAAKKLSESPDMPKHVKKTARELAKKIIIHCNDKLRITWAFAWMVHPTKAKDKAKREYYKKNIELSKDMLYPCLVEAVKHYYVMSISPRIMQYIPSKDVYDTVAHEFAHLLQFHYIGNSYHDEEWRSYHKAMGGNGEIYIPFEVPLRVFKTKKPMKKR